MWCMSFPQTRPVNNLVSNLHHIVFFIAEEIFQSYMAHWWSPDGLRLAYATINDTLVPKMEMPMFTGSLYPSAQEYHYPKVSHVDRPSQHNYTYTIIYKCALINWWLHAVSRWYRVRICSNRAMYIKLVVSSVVSLFNMSTVLIYHTSRWYLRLAWTEFMNSLIPNMKADIVLIGLFFSFLLKMTPNMTHRLQPWDATSQP